HLSGWPPEGTTPRARGLLGGRRLETSASRDHTGGDVHGSARIEGRPGLRLGRAAGAALALGLLVATGPAVAARGGRASHQARLAAAETTIQTMPPVPGAVFMLSNGIRFTAARDGTVHVPTLLLGAFRGHAGPAGITV